MYIVFLVYGQYITCCYSKTDFSVKVLQESAYETLPVDDCSVDSEHFDVNEVHASKIAPYYSCSNICVNLDSAIHIVNR